MNPLSQLSSQSGDRTQAANRAMAEQCLRKPELLKDIAAGLTDANAALAGDCAEVMTKVAESDAGMVVPYVEKLVPLLGHTTTRVRWEATHALALAADLAPRLITRLLPQLHDMLRKDSSTIVRDYVVEGLGLYAGSGQAAAGKAFPLLAEALTVWEGKHAARALNGLARVAEHEPQHEPAIRTLAYERLDSARGVTRKAAKALLKSIDSHAG